MSFPVIRLKKGKERSLKNFHPWVFSGAIQSAENGLAEGDIVEVQSSEREYLGTGHYHEGSIKVRLFSFRQTAADYPFWKEKIGAAWSLRQQLGFGVIDSTNIFRLVHGEGDGLPGLIIDIYDNAAVIQAHTAGMYRSMPEIVKALQECMPGKLDIIYNKSAESLAKQHITGISNGYLLGSRPENIVKENGLSFSVNWEEGQKTGFFIDQRENRKLLGSYSHGKKVLNAFAYSGGFSVYALAGGAVHVDSVDSSRKAAEWAEKNVALNFSEAPHRFHTEDVSVFLKSQDTTWDIVVLDPPGFAKHLGALDQASIGYRNLNTEGFKRVKPGGLMFTFSCSQVVDAPLFRKLVFQAAAQSRRSVKILHQLHQPPDHPVSIYHPEGEYLKGLVLHVD